VKFYSTVDLNDPSLTDRLEEWQFFITGIVFTAHSLGALPWNTATNCWTQPPISQVAAQYEPKSERVRVRDYLADQRLAKLKGCL
jgi:hypothetical protein